MKLIRIRNTDNKNQHLTSLSMQIHGHDEIEGLKHAGKKFATCCLK